MRFEGALAIFLLFLCTGMKDGIAETDLPDVEVLFFGVDDPGLF